MQTPAQFEVNDVKAINIAKVLVDLIARGHWLVSMPEYQLPKNLLAGSREHALYMTYVISIDYMTDAERLWQRARRAYELSPERFTPENVLAMSGEGKVFLGT